MVEPASYNFDIKYRPERDNVTTDTLSRTYSSAVSLDTREKLHSSLCHHNVTRMTHFVRSRNLPFPMEDVERLFASCAGCAEGKPRFYRPDDLLLIKATSFLKGSTLISKDFCLPLLIICFYLL